MILAFSGTRAPILRPGIKVRIVSLIGAMQPGDEIIVCDNPAGVDALVQATALRNRMLSLVRRPWNEGKHAGMLGNRVMARWGDALWAFPERDESDAGSGTWNAIRTFEQASKRVAIFGPGENGEGAWKRLTK